MASAKIYFKNYYIIVSWYIRTCTLETVLSTILSAKICLFRDACTSRDFSGLILTQTVDTISKSFITLHIVENSKTTRLFVDHMPNATSICLNDQILSRIALITSNL